MNSTAPCGTFCYGNEPKTLLPNTLQYGSTPLQLHLASSSTCSIVHEFQLNSSSCELTLYARLEATVRLIGSINYTSIKYIKRRSRKSGTFDTRLVYQVSIHVNTYLFNGIKKRTVRRQNAQEKMVLELFGNHIVEMWPCPIVDNVNDFSSRKHVDCLADQL